MTKSTDLSPEMDQWFSLALEEYKKTLTPEERMRFEQDYEWIKRFFAEKDAEREQVRAQQKRMNDMMEQFLRQAK